MEGGYPDVFPGVFFLGKEKTPVGIFLLERGNGLFLDGPFCLQ